jgi:hypothetical protein
MGMAVVGDLRFVSVVKKTAFPGPLTLTMDEYAYCDLICGVID